MPSSPRFMIFRRSVSPRIRPEVAAAVSEPVSGEKQSVEVTWQHRCGGYPDGGIPEPPPQIHAIPRPNVSAQTGFAMV